MREQPQGYRYRSGGLMFDTLVRKAALGATAALLAATLGACGSEEKVPGATATASSGPSSSDAPATEGSSGETGFTPEDVPEPGEDLLDGMRVGAQFTGATLESTWKFPESFEAAPGVTTRAYSKDKHLRIKMLSGPGDQAKAAAAMENAQRQAEAEGQKTTIDTVTVAGREFAVLVQDTPKIGIITYAHAPEEGEEFYIVQFASDINLADVPQEQFDAFLQTVGSLEFEKA